MKKYNTEAIVEGLRLRDSRVLSYIYKAYFQTIERLITNNSGSEEDASDIFQEAIVIVFNKIEKEELTLNCSFKTYLYSVCRLLWLKQLQARKASAAETQDINDINEIVDIDDEVYDEYKENLRYKLYQEHFSRLGKDCQKVLKLYLKKTSFKGIADSMGYKSEKYAKKRKYICKANLIRGIKEDPMFKSLCEGEIPEEIDL